MNWSEDPPQEPGRYWFYGEAWMGEMGEHFLPNYQPKYSLRMVEVHQASNALIAVVAGTFMPLKKWNGKTRGYLGFWQKIQEPELPKV